MAEPRQQILLKRDDDGFQAYWVADWAAGQRWTEIRHFKMPAEQTALRDWIVSKLTL